MYQETERRRSLARRVAEHFSEMLKTRAAIVVGSTARGQADRYSDIDMSIFHDAFPDAGEFERVRAALGCSDWRMLSEPSDRGFVETFMIDGIECQIGHSTLGYFDEIIEDVLMRYDTEHDKHVILGGVAESLPLHGGPLVQMWKERIAIYPTELAESMVRAHLNFRPLWVLRRRVAGRDTLIVFHDLMLGIVRSLLGVCLGLNRIYPEHDYKRLGGLIGRMTLAPEDFDSRIRVLLGGDYERAILTAESLIEETFTLVEAHMPSVETGAARERFARPEPAA